VGPSCPSMFVVVGGTSLSPLLLSSVPLLLGSVLLRRMLPPTDRTGLPGVSATGDRSSLGIPSVRAPCTMELKNRQINHLPSSRWGGDGSDSLPRLSVVVLLLVILGGGVPTIFQPFVSSSEVKTTSSSLPTNPGLVAGGGVISSMNQSWWAIRNSSTS